MMNNYYENQSIPRSERVVLAEDLKLPGSPISLASSAYPKIKGKFFMPLMTPLMEQEETNNQEKSSPSNKGQISSSKLQTDSYSSSNYFELSIPVYLLLGFENTIPKGTEFIITSIGGSISIEDMRIIGLYTTFE